MQQFKKMLVVFSALLALSSLNSVPLLAQTFRGGINGTVTDPSGAVVPSARVDALLDGDTEFRCKDCHGPLKLHRRHTVGTASYLEHKLKIDSEHCQQGARFLEAADGRAHRQSATPVA